MITPNQFEAEKLTGMDIKNEDDAFIAIDKLHELGPDIVIITSTHLKEEEGIIQLFGSKKKQHRIKMDIPKIVGDQPTYTGTGDVLSAMLVANVDSHSDAEFPTAVEKAVNVVRGVLLKTVEEPMLGTQELNLIASKNVVENPNIDVKV